MSSLVVTLTVEELKSLISEEIEKSFKEHYPKSPVKFITPKEACKLLGISLPTLRSYGKQGKLKESRIGRKILYVQTEVEEAITTIKRYQPIKAA